MLTIGKMIVAGLEYYNVVVSALDLWTWTLALEFNQDLGWQIVPMVVKILDNFILDISVGCVQHGTQELVPHGLTLARYADSAQGGNPRAHHRHANLPHFDHPPTLGRLLTRGRDGHHKKPLSGTSGTSCARA